MTFTVLDREEAEKIRGFLSEDEFEDFLSAGDRYALCAVDGDRLCGVGLFDTGDTCEIREIRVTDDFKGEAEEAIIQGIVSTCEGLGAGGITMEVYDDDDALFYDRLLTKEGFTHVHKATSYRFLLSELENSPMLKKAKPGKNITALGEADPLLLKAFSNKLIAERAYDHFMNSYHDPGLSVVSIENGDVTGCVLVDDLGMEEGFYISYVYYSNRQYPGHVLELLAAAAERTQEHYISEDVYGYVLTMNEISEKLVHKLLPEAQILDHCNTYARIPG
ncbi:MAG: hypothetical protein IJ873_04050 [Lachnospiraceae bacterium]|nr:hypothetical protein [Lachnospiraceae bacterium]